MSLNPYKADEENVNEKDTLRLQVFHVPSPTVSSIFSNFLPSSFSLLAGIEKDM